ncbi:MAG: histidine kinase [Pseudomonadota bacterium]|nr:histidine kinase [Pseudomonadota bacterium]
MSGSSARLLGERASRSLLTAWKPAPDGPSWAPWAWTAVLNTVIATLLTLFVPRTGGFGSNLLVSQTIGLTIHAMFWTLGRGLRFDMFMLPAALRIAYVLSVVLAGSWLGYAAAAWWRLGDWNRLVEHMMQASGFLVVIPLFWAAATMAVLGFVNRLRGRQLAHERERSARAAAEREAISARLQLLNAQIEPHFLYNTLASVMALIPPDAPDARRLIDALTAYLRASSRNMARPLVALADELDSVRGYLDVMQLRLGGRLRVRYAVPAGADAVRVPPAALQTLVENAIKHGIEPSPAGGEITVSASPGRNGWVLEVGDSGAGLGDAPASGGGAGLANLAERLRLALGPDATLTLESRRAGGTVARIVLPAGEGKALDAGPDR